MQVESPILGAVEAGRGRVAVYGDSNCLDSSHMVSNCYWLLKKLLDFTSSDIQDPVIFPATNELGSPMGSVDSPLPLRRDDVDFSAYSLVLKHPLQCGLDSPRAVQGSKGYTSDQSEYISKNRNILQPNGHLQPGESKNASLEGASPTNTPPRKDSSLDSSRQDTSANVSASISDPEAGNISGSALPTQPKAVANEPAPELRAANRKKAKKTSQLPGWWTRDEVSTFISCLLYWMRYIASLCACFNFPGPAYH